MNDPKPIALGTRLGPYLLGESVGTGASATVYRAVDGEGRIFAVKVRRLGVVSLDRRFLREFESMRSLRLPGVVRVYEAGIEDDFLWFSMDLVDGVAFNEAIIAAPPAERITRTVELSRQLLDILGNLHQAGFVHRDVKPSNVLVDREQRVRVLDFGIARFFGEGETGSDSGQVLGTVPFMSPEQLAGLPFDHRVDLFAAGVMIYEAIDGPRPKPASPVGWIPRICLERLRPLASKHKNVPRRLSHVVERLCAVDPFDRPSAHESVRELRRIQSGDLAGNWPEPTWVETADWPDMEGCLGNSQYSPVQILEGSTGSGRRRLAEQVHRQGVMQGIWPIHVTCRVDGVGAPMARAIEILLGASEDPNWRKEIAGEDRDLLRRMWPHLPIPGAAGDGAVPAIAEVAQAVARTILRGTQRRAMLLIVHALEAVDELTHQALVRLSGHANMRLGVLLLHEPRWETPRSKALVLGLKARAAGYHTMPLLTEAQAHQVAKALCPDGVVPQLSGAMTPERAVEAGFEALAAWRGEIYDAADPALWPLVVRPTLPDVVFARLAGAVALDSPWIRREDGEVTLVGEHAWKRMGSRLADQRATARAIADAWVAELGAAHDPGELATLRLLAGEPGAAYTPALLAASLAEEYERYADARRWLLVLDTLPHENPTAREAERGFELAWVRARVVLHTEAGEPRASFVDTCERVAATPEQDQLVKVLRAEYQLRAGEIRPALVAALRVASPTMAPLPHAAVRALLVATQARFMLAQFEEARPQLERARAILAEHAHPRLEVQAANLLAELLYRSGDLKACRTLLQDTIRRASEARYVRGAALASSRLGQVLRALGKRNEAEHQTRTAREAFQATNDFRLEAEVALDLAILRAERGDAAGARHLADDALQQVQGLATDAMVARAMRVSLLVATLRSDPTDALMALQTLEASHDPEASPLLVRWWRVRGDVDRAMRVDAPPFDTWGHALWRAERARAALTAGDVDTAVSEAETALSTASRRGFVEIVTYAKLLLGVLRPGDDVAWRELQRTSAQSLFTEVYLGALEMDARRLVAKGDVAEARARWRALKARAEELGYQPGVEEASGWLADAETT